MCVETFKQHQSKVEKEKKKNRGATDKLREENVDTATSFEIYV